jgi:hypothetical protein
MNAPKPITVDDHQRFRESIARRTDRFKEGDQAAADAERRLNRRSKREASRVLNILDELDREGCIR